MCVCEGGARFRILGGGGGGGGGQGGGANFCWLQTDRSPSSNQCQINTFLTLHTDSFDLCKLVFHVNTCMLFYTTKKTGGIGYTSLEVGCSR